MTDFFNKNTPDELMKLLVESVFGPGIVLTLFCSYLFLTGWLEVFKTTRELAGKAGGVVRAVRGHVQVMPGAKLASSIVMSVILVAVQVAWLGTVGIMANVIAFAYFPSDAAKGNVLNLEGSQVLSGIMAVHWGQFNLLWIGLAIACLIGSFVSDSRGVAGAWVASVPALPWGFSIGALSVFILILDLMQELFLGTWPANDHLAWFAAFTGVVTAFWLASLAACRSAGYLRTLWLGHRR